MSRRGYQWAAGASLGVALLLTGCGAPGLEPETAAGFQASVRDIATAAAAGDQAGATQLALDLSQAVTVAQGQGTVTSDRADQITTTIDELVLAIAAEVGNADPTVPAPPPTTNTPAPLPEIPAETPAPPVGPPAGGDDEEDNRDDAGGEDDNAQREAERELEKQQREQEKLDKEAEREQEQRDDAEDDG